MTSSGFWKNAEPQVLLVQSELCAAAFPHEIACRLPYHQVHGVWRRTRHNPWRCSTTPSQRLQKDFRDVGLRGWTVLLGCKTTAATVFFLQHFCQGCLGKMPHVRELQPWFVAPQAKHDIFSILSGLQANSSKAYGQVCHFYAMIGHLYVIHYDNIWHLLLAMALTVLPVTHSLQLIIGPACARFIQERQDGHLSSTYVQWENILGTNKNSTSGKTRSKLVEKSTSLSMFLLC